MDIYPSQNPKTPKAPRKAGRHHRTILYLIFALCISLTAGGLTPSATVTAKTSAAAAKRTANGRKISTLKKQLQKTVKGYGGTWSIYVKDLNTGASLSINDKAMHPASTIKAFVMAATFDRIKSKKLSYSSTIRKLLNSMITVSDNESYNQLIRHIGGGSFYTGFKRVNSFLKKNGYSHTGCHGTLHPAASRRASDGGRTLSCAKDCGLLLEDIYQGTCVSKKYSQMMLNLLLKQTRRSKIPSGVPSGRKVANKTGENSTQQHDIAIVYGKKTTYVICVYSSNAPSAISRIRTISKKVYNFLNS